MTRYIGVKDGKVQIVIFASTEPVVSGHTIGISDVANMGDSATVLPNKQVQVTQVFVPQNNTNLMTKLSFLKRFTAPERIAIREAAKVTPALEDFMDLLNSSQNIDLNDELLQAGLVGLVNAGLVTEARRVEIMTP